MYRILKLMKINISRDIDIYYSREVEDYVNIYKKKYESEI